MTFYRRLFRNRGAGFSSQFGNQTLTSKEVSYNFAHLQQISAFTSRAKFRNALL